MQLSARLEAAAGLVGSGMRLADVGTDHAHVPIALCLRGRIPSAIAMDVNPGPLARAGENIRAHCLEDRIRTRLSDGLRELGEDEADSVLIAGMGGLLTVRILQEGFGQNKRPVAQEQPVPGKRAGGGGLSASGEGTGRLGSVRELILQPQSDIRSVRLWLAEHAWAIAEEHVIYEEGKAYPMMRAVPAAQAGSRKTDARGPGEVPLLLPAGEGEDILTALWIPDDRFPDLTARELELRFGPVLLYRRPAELLPLLERNRLMTIRILEGLKGRDSESAREGRAERERDLCCLEAAILIARHCMGEGPQRQERRRRS